MPSALSGMALCVFARCMLLGSTAAPAPPAAAALPEADGRAGEAGPIDAMGLIRQSDLPLTITRSGEWGVWGNLNTEGKLLKIDAPDVTLDLNGFTIDGGIWIISADGLTVRNGEMLAEFPYYIINGDPPDRATVESLIIDGGAEDVLIDLGNHSVVRDVIIGRIVAEIVLRAGDDCDLSNIFMHADTERWASVVAGDRAVARNCTLRFGGGLHLGGDALVEECYVRTPFATAILVGDHSRVLHSTGSTDPGSLPGLGHAHGIDAGDGAWIAHSFGGGNDGIVAGANATVIDCEASAYSDPISVGPGSLVQGCDIRYADSTVAIRVGGDSRVIDNVLSSSLGPAPFGIVANGDSNYIAGNRVGGNWHGISAPGSDNVIIDNTIGGYPEAVIFLGGSGNRVERNELLHVWIGVQAPEPGNLIIANTLHEVRRQAFELAPGNAVGEIIDTTNGGVVPPGNCWANVIK